jgi:hypothetical protein
VNPDTGVSASVIYYTSSADGTTTVMQADDNGKRTAILDVRACLCHTFCAACVMPSVLLVSYPLCCLGPAGCLVRVHSAFAKLAAAVQLFFLSLCYDEMHVVTGKECCQQPHRALSAVRQQ